MKALDYVMPFAVTNKRDGATHGAVLLVPHGMGVAAHIAGHYDYENYFQDANRPTGYGATATEAVEDLAAKLGMEV